MRIPPLLLAAAVLLSGCSGGDGGSDTADPASSSTSTSLAPAKPVPTTDTLHFLTAPAMTTDPADLTAEAASPVTTGNFGDNQQPQGATWRRQVAAPGNITGGEVHVWVEIKETMLDSSAASQQPCTWRLLLEVGADSPVTLCLNEPAGPIQPGTKELVFSFSTQGAIGLEANETVAVTLQRTAFSLSPNNAVDALSGTPEHDSYVRLTGLKEPVRSA